MDNIETAHKIFRDEVTTASWSFFVWKSINNIAASDKDAYRALNENALSWITITHSLQSTFFITLGRLFDIDGDAFSVHAFLRSCLDHIDQFSLEEVRKRKIKINGGSTPEWLDRYMENAYQPKESDFQRLRGEVSKQQRVYEEIYRPIRHRVIAHKESASIDIESELFSKTNIGQIQEFINFMYQIHNIIFDLLYNGSLNEIGTYKFTEDKRVHDDVEALLKRLKSTSRG